MKLEEISPPKLRELVETQLFVYEALVVALHVLEASLDGRAHCLSMCHAHTLLVAARDRMQDHYGFNKEEEDG